MQDFYEYLWALAGYGKWLLTGGPFLVENVVKRIKPRWIQWLDQKISEFVRIRIEIGIFLIAIFLAGFFAWRDEHLARALAEYKLTGQKPGSPAIISSKYVCTTEISPLTPNGFAILFEFGVKGFTTTGFAAAIAVDQTIRKGENWEGPPLRTDVPPNRGGAYTNSGGETEGNVYRRFFASPSLSPTQSEYVYLESDKPMRIMEIMFLEDINAMPDQVKANKMASIFETCPR